MKNKEIISYIERACIWSLNSIIWTYHILVIVKSGIQKKNKRFSAERKKNTLDKISKGHIPFQHSLLTYLVYYLGAFAENCKINNISFKFDKKVTINLINHFFLTVDKFLKDKNFGYQECNFELHKEKYNFNKSIIKAHKPGLNKSEIENIADWFVKNYATDHFIQKVFISARHYFYLENTGYMNKVSGPGKSNAKALINLKPGHFDKFVGTGLSKKVSLRLSYFALNINFSEGIFKNYQINSKKKLNKILKFSKGPYLTKLYTR